MQLTPHNYSLRQLQYAIAVAEALSFRKAAERCQVSQPSLSAQIAELERVLRVRLFERDRRRVLPTAAGRDVVERARRILLEADELALAARQLADPLIGTLRIGAIPTISPYLLPVIAPKLRERFPKLSIVWIEEKTETLLRELDKGDLDAALLALEAEIGDLERKVVGYDAFVLATPAGHPLGKPKKPATIAELRDVDVLLLDDGHCLRDQALALCSKAKAKELEFRATSLSTLAQMVAAGSGVTLLPSLAVATEAARAGLKVRPFVEPAPKRTIALTWRKRAAATASLRQVADAIRDCYPGAAALRGLE